MTVFTPAGETAGIPLASHECGRFGITYVSALPSAAGDPYTVPGCGCRPEEADAEPQKHGGEWKEPGGG